MTLPVYDVVVIGGGIHGVGVAQAAAVQGYKVLLLEKKEVASGTSSRSSKLIHGGLRYLESKQFSLVRECLRERAFLLKRAPHLVKRVPFFIPLYENTSRPAWKIRLGLSLYAVLGGLGEDVRFRSLPRSEWENLDGLETGSLQAVFQYYDAQTDDKALTEAVLRSAQLYGAEVCMPASFHSATLTQEGSELRFVTTQGEQHCRTKVIVNAAGPWVNRVLESIEPRPSSRSILLVQGAHLLLPGSLERGIYYVESPQNHRPVFVMPWKERILVGTTETAFTGDPDRVSAQRGEKEYLLATLKHYFPTMASVTENDLLGTFAGLRVLPVASKEMGKLPRETLYHRDRPHKPRLLSIYGGKLTAYRHTAEEVMRRIIPSLSSPKRFLCTRDIDLTEEL